MFWNSIGGGGAEPLSDEPSMTAEPLSAWSYLTPFDGSEDTKSQARCGDLGVFATVR